MAMFTIVFGSLMAEKEHHLKRRLAYSTVSNLSYILFGVTLMTPEGLAAGLAHMIFHGVMKICLFFCAGHPVRDVFVYDRYRQQSVLALVNPDGCFHNQIAVVTVNQLVDILFFPVITWQPERLLR